MSKHRMTANRGKPLERRGGWAKGTALFSMGPPLFNNFVLKTVFNKEGYQNGDIPGIGSAMTVLRNEAGGLVATGQFKSECNSFLAEPFEGCRALDRSELYDAYNMSRWGVAVKERWETTERKK